MRRFVLAGLIMMVCLAVAACGGNNTANNSGGGGDKCAKKCGDAGKSPDDVLKEFAAAFESLDAERTSMFFQEADRAEMKTEFEGILGRYKKGGLTAKVNCDPAKIEGDKATSTFHIVATDKTGKEGKRDQPIKLTKDSGGKWWCVKSE